MKIVNLISLAGAGGILAHGCFDVLHVGHVRYLRQAAQFGPLIVTVTADAFVNKGPRRPYHNHDDRVEMLAALECVSAVAINHAPAELPVIEIIRPRLYCKGTEYVAGNPVLDEARALLESYGGRLIFIDDGGKRYSSTAIIAELRGGV